MIRRLLNTLTLLILSAIEAQSQIPQAFKYQAVARDASGNVLVNKLVSIRTSILLGGPTGSSVYAETQSIATNDFGVITLNIGEGTIVSGNFTDINWGATTYFIKTELDVTGGTNYQFMGITQLLSVPYALYSEKTGSSNNDHDTSSTNEIQVISFNNDTLYLSNGGQIFLGKYLDNTDKQTLNITGNKLEISGGNSVTFSGAVDLDADPTNELQFLSRGHDTLYLSKGNYTVMPKNLDNDSTNEIQFLSRGHDTLYLSKGNFSVLPKNLDNDSTNELQNLTLIDGTINISKGNKIHLPDSSSTNEIQTITLERDNIINLSKNGGSIEIPLPNLNFNRELCNVGDGLDGDFISNGSSSITGMKHYNNFWLKQGDVLNISNTLLLRVKDTCKIEGVINGQGKGANSNYPSPTFGATGGGQGGNWCGAWYPGENATNDNIDLLLDNYVLSGGRGGRNGEDGQDGQSWDTINILKGLSTNNLILLHGLAGSGADNPYGAGGAGIYIICKVLLFSGSINLEGNDGQNASIDYQNPNNSDPFVRRKASGGGGGGTCVISFEKEKTFNGIILQEGGTGGLGLPTNTYLNQSQCGGYLKANNAGNGGSGKLIKIRR